MNQKTSDIWPWLLVFCPAGIKNVELSLYLNIHEVYSNMSMVYGSDVLVAFDSLWHSIACISKYSILLAECPMNGF